MSLYDEWEKQKPQIIIHSVTFDLAIESELKALQSMHGVSLPLDYTRLGKITIPIMSKQMLKFKRLRNKLNKQKERKNV